MVAKPLKREGFLLSLSYIITNIAQEKNTEIVYKLMYAFLLSFLRVTSPESIPEGPPFRGFQLLNSIR